MSIPLVIQEQNAIAGTTNRILARFAIKIFTGFPNVFAGHKAASYSGNPLRTSFYQQLLSNESTGKDERSESTPINILVLGGSLGAQSLNQVVPSALAKLGVKTDFSVRHQAGKKDVAIVVETYQSSHIDARVDAFIDDIYQAYNKADLVIARAGALTVSEIAAVGVACVLIPYPYATDDHQRANAEWLVKTGGAICIDDAEFTVAKASAVIGELLTNRGELMARGNKVSSMAMPNATDIVADACLGYAYA